MSGEFKKFILRGNVMDLAVGVIIGAAFGAIVNSLVDDIIMPFVGFITGGGVDFSDYFINLSGQEVTSLAVIGYGNFITVLINFLILAVIVFLIVRSVNRIVDVAVDEAETPAAPPAPTKQEALLAEIRDLLKEQRG
jgi:large conductance mechanosensitive channel